jgi:hypothetical protein
MVTSFDLDRVGQRAAYLELYAREDGRARSFVFSRMGIPAVLAVFTADAADGPDRPSPWCTSRSSRPDVALAHHP